MGSRSDACGIRRAVAADAALLSELGTTTFREAFSHLYAADDLEAFLSKAHAATYYERLLRDPDVAIWIATPPGEEPIGYVVVGICRLPVPNLEPRAGEIRRLYVRIPGQSSGIGTKLLRTSLDWLATRKFSPLYVGVWSSNFGAQRLYQRYGFEKIGEYEFSVGKQRDHEFIFRQTPSVPSS